MSNVVMKKIVKKYGRTQVIHGIDLEIPSARLTVLLGPSGCGKSTILRMIAGLEDINSGDLLIGSERVNDVPPSKRGCGMVFQTYALYPHQTVFRNIAFPLRMAHIAKAEIEKRVAAIAEVLELTPFLNRLPRDLSGGQRQRVAMGRAMIREPKVYLFDEPLSNLDAELRVKMRLEIARIQKQLDATMVFVTHDQVEAMTLAHQIVVMREGNIEQVGPPLEVYQKPATRFVAAFVGSPSMNFMAIRRIERNGSQSRLILEGDLQVSLPVRVDDAAETLGVRPQHISFGKTKSSFSVPADAYQYLGAEHLGDRAYDYLSLPSGELTVLAEKDRQFDNGEALWVALDPQHLHFFDAQGRTLEKEA